MQVISPTQGRYSGFAPSSYAEMRNAVRDRQRASYRQAKPKIIYLPKPKDDEVPERDANSHVIAWRYWMLGRDTVERRRVMSDFLAICPFGMGDIASENRSFIFAMWRGAISEALRRYTGASNAMCASIIGVSRKAVIKYMSYYRSDDISVNLASGPTGIEFKFLQTSRNSWETQAQIILSLKADDWMDTDEISKATGFHNHPKTRQSLLLLYNNGIIDRRNNVGKKRGYQYILRDERMKTGL